MLKIIFNILAIIFLVVCQIGFLPTLPNPINNFNLSLCLIIFIAVILSFDLALWYALALGVLLEMFSLYPYGIILVSFLLTIFLINWLFKHFFTNRSFYSLIALGLVGVIFYYLLILGWDYLFYFLKLTNLNLELNHFYFYNLLWQIALQLILLATAFLLLNFVSRQLKTVFLLEK